MADLNAVICLGEALVDRLGPPGGNPECCLLYTSPSPRDP